MGKDTELERHGPEEENMVQNFIKDFAVRMVQRSGTVARGGCGVQRGFSFLGRSLLIAVTLYADGTDCQSRKN